MKKESKYDKRDCIDTKHVGDFEQVTLQRYMDPDDVAAWSRGEYYSVFPEQWSRGDNYGNTLLEKNPHSKKEYIAVIKLGEETDTLDLTGKVIFSSN